MNRKMIKKIKRYQNRKLYDTQDSCYVTLEDIRDMIKEGQDLQVIDNASKEDLTSVTLAQIILEEEKKNKSMIPINELKTIIASGGGVIREFVQRSLESGAREIGVVKNFVDKQISSTVESVKDLPGVAQEIRSMRKKINELEEKLQQYEKEDK